MTGDKALTVEVGGAAVEVEVKTPKRKMGEEKQKQKEGEAGGDTQPKLVPEVYEVGSQVSCKTSFDGQQRKWSSARKDSHARSRLSLSFICLFSA